MEACLSTVGGRVFFLSFSDSVTIRESTPFSVRLFLLANRLKPFINKGIPPTGLEPVRHYWQRILNPQCLPFHHGGV